MSDVLAIIPARGGSRGVPGKNLAPVAGRPLIAWTVDAARGAKCIGRTVVTTDHADIADAARAEGAEVPFMRPAFLAADDTPGIDPLVHALLWLAEHEGFRPQWVVCLQPTSPLRISADIDAAFELVRTHGAQAVISVTRSPVHPRWLMRLDDDGRCEPWHGSPPPQRQAAQPAWALNGAIYLAQTQWLLDNRTWYGEHTFAMPMPEERSLDVDTPWQMHLADLCLRQGRELKVAS